MALDGFVAAHDDGSIELLPCPLTDLISKRGGLIFDAFYISLRDDGVSGALLCAYTALLEQHYIFYDVVLSATEYEALCDL